MSGRVLDVVVGTAGHVDHGKTALVRALTGIDTDRLPEEKRRGITLEAGYAHLALPGLGVAGLVDVPGHERFLRAMVAAAGGIDVAVLCVALDEGPMPQTREHLDVLRLLGARAGVVALTKSDLAATLGEEHVELVRLEVRELVAQTFLEGAPVVQVSARTGLGLPELLQALAAAVRVAAEHPRAEKGPLFLPLDRSFTLAGFGTIVTGTLASGSLGALDAVELVGPEGVREQVRVRGVQVHGQPVERARAGQRTAANLVGPEVTEAPRGAALVCAGTRALTGPVRVLDVQLSLLASAPGPLPDRARVLLHLGCAQVPAVVALLDRALLQPGEEALGQLRLSAEVAAIAGLRFLLRGALAASRGAGPARRPGAPLTLGGGRVLAVASRRRRRGRASDTAALLALASDDPLSRAELLLLEAGLPGCTPALLVARGGESLRGAGQALERLAQTGRATLFDRDARRFVHPGLFARLLSRLSRLLDERAGAQPLDPWLLREELRQRAGEPPLKLFSRAVQALVEQGAARAETERVAAGSISEALPAADQDALGLLAALLEHAALAPPRLDELPALLQAKAPRVAQLLKALAAEGRVVKVSEELWFAAPALRSLEQALRAHLAREGAIDAQGYKQLTGQSRKFTIPLAEHFDRLRVTLRVGDKRVARQQR